MKYLVLGSKGQIGNSLVKYLRALKHECIEFDIENSKFEDLRFHNNEILEKYISEVDFVFFLAFDVGGSRYLAQYQNTYDYIHNNISLMKETFELLKKYNAKFLFTSSQMSNMFYSNYGTLKYIGEMYTKVLNGLVVKLWNVYGNEYNDKKAHVITDFIKMARNNRRIDMLTTGEESRQMLYVEDCCECLEILSRDCNYYNISREKQLHIASFKWETITDIARIISTHYNVVCYKANKIDSIQLDKKNEPDNYILNFWKPRTTLENGIKQIIQNIEENK